jgi:hypothetical protein
MTNYGYAKTTEYYKSTPLFFCVSAIRHDSSLSKYRKQKQSPPPPTGNTQNGARPGGWLLLFTVLAEWRIMTSNAYAKNNGDELLYSILCQNIGKTKKSGFYIVSILWLHRLHSKLDCFENDFSYHGSKVKFFY